MTYTELQSISDFSLRSFMNFPNLDTPIFYPMFLFVVYVVITSVTFFKELSREGKGNILSSLAVGGFVTMSISVILRLMGLIQTAIMVVVLVIFLVFAVIYLLTGRE